ncbi:MAG: hypothetical protein ABII01_07490 [Candidatus Woesearchaeota archaeon]
MGQLTMDLRGGRFARDVANEEALDIAHALKTHFYKPERRLFEEELELEQGRWKPTTRGRLHSGDSIETFFAFYSIGDKPFCQEYGDLLVDLYVLAGGCSEPSEALEYAYGNLNPDTSTRHINQARALIMCHTLGRFEETDELLREIKVQCYKKEFGLYSSAEVLESGNERSVFNYLFSLHFPVNVAFAVALHELGKYDERDQLLETIESHFRAGERYKPSTCHCMSGFLFRDGGNGPDRGYLWAEGRSADMAQAQINLGILYHNLGKEGRARELFDGLVQEFYDPEERKIRGENWDLEINSQMLAFARAIGEGFIAGELESALLEGRTSPNLDRKHNLFLHVDGVDNYCNSWACWNTPAIIALSGNYDKVIF